ncbi:MAG: hypothetical protein WCH01_20925 [Methylococcaceae bacterium]
MLRDDVKVLYWFILIMISLSGIFWSVGQFNRTATPPLTKLSLTQAGCEYVSRAGLPSEIKNGICTLTVRFRSTNFGDDGIIEQPSSPPVNIRGGQIVGTTQIDDGSGQPWSKDHQMAIAYILGSILTMLLAMWWLTVDTSKSYRKRKQLKSKGN